MKRFLILTMLMAVVCGLACAKKTLGHDDFDQWQKVYNISVSNNGEWTAFMVNPQEGDGVLTFYNTKTGKKIEIDRGYTPSFSADSKWGIALVKPYFAETRQAKIKKKTGFDLPQDSLYIVNLSTGEIEKKGNVISYKIGKKGGEWISWLSCDTAHIDQSELDNKKAGRPMFVRNLRNGEESKISYVGEYDFSEKGNALGVTLLKSKNDSLSADGVAVIMLPDTALRIIDSEKKFYSLPVFDREGKMMAYVASSDSAESGTKKSNLFLARLSTGEPETKEIKITPGENLFINQYSKPEFSYNSRRLIIGVAPYVAPDDTTLVDFEKASLDIWRWDAPYTPPQENNRIERIRKHTYPVVVDLSNGNNVLMTDNPLVKVYAPDRWDAEWALVEDPSENIISLQWNYQFPVSLSVKNIGNGEVKDVVMAENESFDLSPAAKYVVWFKDRHYYAYEIASGNTVMISGEIPYPLWDESNDTPLLSQESYGIMGWGENDSEILIYDKYDVWSLDPKGNRKPVCLTGGEGRKKNLRFRNIKTDPEFRNFKSGEQVLYSVFDYGTKENGLATSKFDGVPKAPKIDFFGKQSYSQVRKGLEAPVYSWIQGNFETSPNVYVSTDLSKGNLVKVSNSNPQLADYKWGTAQLFKWYAYDGTPSEGVLYLPEDFDPDKSYPMISYFYEIYSDDLYRHYDMEPSWSWINFPFYVSRDYVVFVPDIHYTAGVPGECAWNFVCSGVEEVLRQYPNIDAKRIGIDGQSWGGYQTAYLVTRTNMFACAGSGAPVANMTSAFGGIRWESGDSRQAQYEKGQSRIGRNLWESPALYIANSPVFYADRVETPLLIMHNDADGAVPWYQGIEMFMALRRLGKPVWMLQYNSEAHNLKERRNRKDITQRLQQFFDHYLKGDPMPDWMKKGIPAVRKGQEYGF